MSIDQPIRCAVVTGTRAESGLLAPVIAAFRAHERSTPLVFAAGAHLATDPPTVIELRAQYDLAAEIPMQEPGVTGRFPDARALGRGITGFAAAFERTDPTWVLVLGDRIEALAAACAAAVAQIPVAHIHAGDRAEGVADEGIRGAISKLAHLHLCATEQSAQRVVRTGERPEHVVVTGSPAVSGISSVEPMDDAAFRALGSPTVVVLHHPAGLGAEHESRTARAIAGAVCTPDGSERTLWLHPNLDPDREAVFDVLTECAQQEHVTDCAHLPHAVFRSLIKRLGTQGGVLVGNSSAALIEGALLRAPAVDIGPRQAGRERASNVIHCAGDTTEQIRAAMIVARALDTSALEHPYGGEDAPDKIVAALVARTGQIPELLRKRCTF
jgi:UDP-hydrolysing UDP-N-acetyl-D-glucosamine 2-epimerase